MKTQEIGGDFSAVAIDFLFVKFPVIADLVI